MIVITTIVFVLISIALFLPLKPKYERAIFNLVTIILLAISVFRTGEGLYDYKQYIYLFEHYQEVPIEVSFVMISDIVHSYFASDTFFLFAIYAVIAIFTKWWGIKMLSKLLIPSLFIYFCNFYIAQELIQIRSGVAAGFILLSIKPIYDRKFLLFLFLWIVAVLFHTSAALFFPIYFFSSRSINKKIWVSFIILSYILYILNYDLIRLLSVGVFVDIVSSKLEAYESIEAMANVFSIAQMIKLSVTIILLYYSEKLVSKNKYGYLLLKIMVVSICTLPLFAGSAVLGTRIRDMFGVVEIILLPMIAYIFATKIQGKVAVYIIGTCLFTISTFNLLFRA